ncbi:MAG: hypothetical protein K8R56_07680 [Candidatus Eisenbacteria bacterium]|nr:hypothetical protein [Candidatus Eisenbacteria bacterium]
MKSLPLFVLALLAGAATVSVSHACDATKTAANGGCAAHSKANTATAAAVSKGQVPSVPASGGCSAEAIRVKTAANGAACTADMAAQCTPAMREACAKNPAVAAAMGCNPHGGKTTATAAVASANGKPMMNGAECSAHGMKSASAAGAKCDMSKGVTATAASAGMQCSAHMKAVAHDCDACDDWSDCEKEVRTLGAKAQVVGLKNGAMIVYTADRAGDVRALQTAVAKRNDKMLAALSAGSGKKLCDDCKSLRGAIASGKLHREVVNVDRGCMTLITSDDRAVVQKIRVMTGSPVAMR